MCKDRVYSLFRSTLIFEADDGNPLKVPLRSKNGNGVDCNFHVIIAQKTTRAWWLWFYEKNATHAVVYPGYRQASDTRIPLPRKSLGHPQKIVDLQSWTLYKSADCRWISITILCVSFTNSATVGRHKQVQLCNRRVGQSADNITGLKCANECLILTYKYIQNPWYRGFARRGTHF